ncbi:MAG: ATP-binding protein [Patescibacteria group bacterium]
MNNKITIITPNDIIHRLEVLAKEKEDIGPELAEISQELRRFFTSLEQKIDDHTQALEDASKASQNVLEDLNMERLKTEVAKAKDDAILSSIGEGVIATDQDGKIIIMNNMAEKVLGCKIDEVAGKFYHDIISLEDEKGNIVPLKERPLTNALNHSITTTTSALFISGKSKIKIPVAITTSPIVLDNKVIGGVGVFRDITKEKEVDKAKTEFVSLASHQLRTPLSSISWYTEMLLNEDVGKLNDKQIKYLNEVYRGNKRMVALVNSLLNVSRLELGTFAIDPEPTDILKILQSVIDEQKGDIDPKQIKLSCLFEKIYPLIPVDPKLLRVILENILTNAVKYTSEGGEIQISLSLDKIGNQKNILFKISDTGYGIPKNQQDKIFTKLFRADNVREKDTEGTGLGLYIAKSILSHSDGKIWFKSEENKGTTFFVTIPVSGMKRKEGTKALA